MPSDDFLKEYYTVTNQNADVKTVYHDEDNVKNLNYAYETSANRIKEMLKLNPPIHDTGAPRLLDLGCSLGRFFDFFPDWDVYGVEIEEVAGNIAKSKHENVFVGDMKDADFEKNFFDCVNMQDSLDHSNDPIAVVKHSYEFLKEGGFIVIKVHNINCLLAKVSGKRFYAIVPPEHLTYFNLKTLKLLLSANGFEYVNHYYDTQKLSLRTILMRISVTFPFFTPIYKAVSKSALGSMTLRKNFHDIITVIARKKV